MSEPEHSKKESNAEMEFLRAQLAVYEKDDSVFQLLAKNVHDVIWKMDLGGRYTYISPSVERVLGFTVEEAMAMASDQMVTPESNVMLTEELFKSLKSVRRGQKDIPQYSVLVYEAYCKDGSTKWIEAKISFMKDENGDPVEIVGITRDITERKRADEVREALIQNLQDALSRVKTLSGLLPICASCKRIRDDSGYWSQLEAYLSEHSEAEFTHGYCPECANSIAP